MHVRVVCLVAVVVISSWHAYDFWYVFLCTSARNLETVYDHRSYLHTSTELFVGRFAA
jgi:hypothetical protein